MSNILDRIAKLLAVQEGRGASEAEAAFAAEKVQQLLQEHNLSLSQVEAHAGNTAPTGNRDKTTTDHRAMYAWQRTLMASIADNHFCLHKIVQVKNAKPLYSGGRGMSSRCHLLVGREINVQASLRLYEYLCVTLRALANSAGYTSSSVKEQTFFFEGATSRLTERLDERRRAQEAAPSTSNGSGRELVLSDVYGSESDLNNDMLNGFPVGTTAANRRKSEARMQEQAQVQADLVAQGVSNTEAWYRAYGYSVEQAASLATKYERQSRRGGRGRSTNWTRGNEKHYAKIASASYQSGRTAGSSVGLDDQIAARAANKRLGG